MTDQIPIQNVNKFLMARNSGEAIMAFNREIGSNLSYMFDEGEEFIKKSVKWFFSGLVVIDTNFSVVIGPRKKMQDGTFKHPTYNIGFNDKNGRHFCDFKLTLVKNSYFKMTFPLPDENFFEKRLMKYDFTKQHQSSGNYATVKLERNLNQEDYNHLAGVGYEVRCHYDGTDPSYFIITPSQAINNDTKRDGFLPTKNDCEKAVEAIKDTRKEINENEILNWLELYFKVANVDLKENWKMITKENFQKWFR